MIDDDYRTLIASLKRPDAYAHPVDAIAHIETHISHLLLAGDYAYKLKKPLNLGFLDFSTLERRQFCCAEELRLNRRLAPRLYLDMVTINGSVSAPRVGGSGPVLDYAVKMRRFEQTALLDRQTLDRRLMLELAERVAQFHCSIPCAAPESDFGSLQSVFAPMRENISQLSPLLSLAVERERLARLARWTRKQYRALAPLLAERRVGGHVRECHGDMHRGNIARIDGELVIFDGIEFAPRLRWIDTASEVAFLAMDLEQAAAACCAAIFLARYIECSGDEQLLGVLTFYKVYRALVRAKVAAIRARGSLPGSASRVCLHAELRRYLALAESYTRPRRANLVLMYGVSGSGKSHLARQLQQVCPLLHFRSDVERKRLFGLGERERSASALGCGVYGEDASERTYARLYHLARMGLSGGYDVLVDATFLARRQRCRFANLAHELDAGFALLALSAPVAVLRERVARRFARADDASEATPSVLRRQQANHEPLTADECAHAVLIDSSAMPPLESIVGRLSSALRCKCGSVMGG